MTIRDVLGRATEYLAKKGVENPRLDAELILGKALGLSRLELYTGHDRPVTEAERTQARELIERRGRREPLAYVLGEWGFRRLMLTCDRRALVPRPETEIVVERCVALLDGLAEPAVLDIGTGTGAIALAVADEHPGARVTAVDRSSDALALARENAQRTGIEITLLQGDIGDGLPRGPFDLVVSNPPYVLVDELPELEPEVRDWEPREAIIDEGQTEAVAAAAREVLAPGGWIVLETHGEGAARVAQIVAEKGYAAIRTTKDLSRRERVVEAQWRM